MRHKRTYIKLDGEYKIVQLHGILYLLYVVCANYVLFTMRVV
jgi:hypothetical protein